MVSVRHLNQIHLRILLFLDSADMVREIDLIRHTANGSTVATLIWTQPDGPNSLIHSYQIERTHHDKVRRWSFKFLSFHEFYFRA